MTQRGKLIADALDTWAPSYPRRASRKQYWVDSHPETVRALFDAEDTDGNSPFISTFAFPRGHTTDREIPEVNTLFIDFDFDDGDYVRGSGNRDAWRRDLSHLLLRARQVAAVIDERGEDGWRASLSGHKGIHLFLDFPALDPGMADFDEFIAGINEYAEDLIDEFEAETNLSSLHDYVDVTSSDLGRLCRVPNTLHGGATSSFGEERYCVPVTFEELAGMTPERYEELTAEPRESPWGARSPNSEVAEIIERYIENANTTVTYGSYGGGSSTLDWGRVSEYKETSNGDLSLQDVELLTSDRPCVWEWYLRDDKYQHGNQSHVMESHCIATLIQNNFPISVIQEFLDSAPEYNEEFSERRIEELIARDFNPYSTEKLLERAPEFCGYSWCLRCQKVLEEHDRTTNTT